MRLRKSEQKTAFNNVSTQHSDYCLVVQNYAVFLLPKGNEYFVPRAITTRSSKLFKRSTVELIKKDAVIKVNNGERGKRNSATERFSIKRKNTIAYKTISVYNFKQR